MTGTWNGTASSMQRHPTTIRRALLTALAGVAVVCLTGCGNTGSAPGDVAGVPHGEATCAFTVSYDGTTYIGTHPSVPIELAERLGTATIPPCNDTGRDYGGPIDTRSAYRVEGLDPNDAIAIRNGPNDPPALVAARTPAGPSPAVDAYIAERNPNGSILVTPDRNLHDGDTVTVTIRGLDPGTDAMVAQCAPVQGGFACLTRPTVLIPPAAPQSSAPTPDGDPGRTPAPTTGPGSAPASTTAQHGPDTRIEVSLAIHDPLRGGLGLFDSKGDPVTGRTAPTEIACHRAETLPCIVAVRGIRNGEPVIRYATIHFDPSRPPTSPTG